MALTATARGFWATVVRLICVVSVHGGPRDGEPFAAPLDKLHENTVIRYLEGRYTLIRDPGIRSLARPVPVDDRQPSEDPASPRSA